MKSKIVIVILIVVSVCLFIGLIATQKQAATEKRKAADAAADLSHQVEAAATQLNDLRQVNLMLTNDLALSEQTLMTLSNNLTEALGTLSNTKATLQSAQDQLTNLNGRISDLEAQNKLLDDRANSLTNSLAQLNAQIAETQQKLGSAETNNAFLTAELQRQLAQKAELERKFNDLASVRAQVKVLHTELVVARRLEWIRTGYDPAQKGVSLLMQRTPPPAPAPGHYDLNVDVGSDGSIHVAPPVTNAPAR